MSISKEERQQARIDIRSWGADEKPELVERLLNALDEADSEKAELQQENERIKAAADHVGEVINKYLVHLPVGDSEVSQAIADYRTERGL